MHYLSGTLVPHVVGTRKLPDTRHAAIIGSRARHTEVTAERLTLCRRKRKARRPQSNGSEEAPDFGAPWRNTNTALLNARGREAAQDESCGGWGGGTEMEREKDKEKEEKEEEKEGIQNVRSGG